MTISLVVAAVGFSSEAADFSITWNSALTQANDFAIATGFVDQAGAGVVGYLAMTSSSSGTQPYTDLQTDQNLNIRVNTRGRFLTGQEGELKAFITGESSACAAASVFIFRGVSTVGGATGVAQFADSVSSAGLPVQPDTHAVAVSTAYSAILSVVGSESNSSAAVTAPSGFGDTVQANTINGAGTAKISIAQAWITSTSTGSYDPATWAGFSAASTLWQGYSISIKPADFPIPPSAWKNFNWHEANFRRKTEVVGY